MRGPRMGPSVGSPRWLGMLAAVALTLLASGTASAGDGVAPESVGAAPEAGGARFALVVGVNRGAAPGQPTLRYADDDAARYFDLFRGLGARVYLLTSLDDNTRRLHGQAAAEATPATRPALTAAVERLGADVRRAQARNLKTTLYVIYAGHGVEAEEGRALSLEDGALSATQLVHDVLEPVGADHAHVIVDACGSYSFAYTGARGPGGARRALSGFSRSTDLGARDDVGLLLSTSSARDSHEWEVLQAGVFSHVVRSGLYGAADADGDGQVSYREIAAFTERAGAAIPNERFRPRAHVRPPSGGEQLVDLRGALERRLEVGAAGGHGHVYLEDTRGVRLADFHSQRGHAVWLVRLPHLGRIYLREPRGDREYAVPAAPSVVRLEELTAAVPRVARRGAAHHAFGVLFALPFGPDDVQGYVMTSADAAVDGPGRPTDAPYRLSLGYALGSGYLSGAGLAHGARLEAARVVGPVRLGLLFGWSLSRYEWDHRLDVDAHEFSAGVTLGVPLWRPSWGELAVGLEALGGRVLQRTQDDDRVIDRTGSFFRWAGTVGLDLGRWGPLVFYVRGRLGQTVLQSAGAIEAPLFLGAGVGAAIRL